MKRNEMRSRNGGYVLPQSNTHQDISKPLFVGHPQVSRRQQQRNHDQFESAERSIKHISDFRRESVQEFGNLLL